MQRGEYASSSDQTGFTPYSCITFFGVFPAPRHRMARHRSEQLVALLAANEHAWIALHACVDVEDLECIPWALVRSFAALGKDFEIVKYCIAHEISLTGTYPIAWTPSYSLICPRRSCATLPRISHQQFDHRLFHSSAWPDVAPGHAGASAE